MTSKSLKVKTDFKGGIPIYTTDIELEVYVEEVLNEEPTNNMLKRNREFLTIALINKMEEKIKTDMQEIISYCVENEVDLLGIYKTFNAKNHKKFKKYIKNVGIQKFLSKIEFKTNVKINSEI